MCATIARVVGDPLSDPYDLVANLPSDAAVAPNHVYTSAADRVKPAPDSYRGLQHSLDRLGVDAARSVSTGAGVRVAVLDSAPQTDHPDLPPVRVAKIDGGPRDVGVHGTLTTGVIAAIANNGFGIAGVAPSAVVIAIPVCTPLGASPRDSCGLFDLLRGLDVAWKERAQVLNLSLVGPANPLLERAVDRLDDLGAIVVAAAGNEGIDEARYPASYPSVVGVGAVDVNGARYEHSNGGRSAQIWAPGTDVLSTVPGGAFAFASGTSFAAAHVTGALAVLIGSGAAPDAARRALFQTARSASLAPRAQVSRNSRRRAGEQKAGERRPSASLAQRAQASRSDRRRAETRRLASEDHRMRPPRRRSLRCRTLAQVGHACPYSDPSLDPSRVISATSPRLGRPIRYLHRHVRAPIDRGIRCAGSHRAGCGGGGHHDAPERRGGHDLRRRGQRDRLGHE